MYEINLGTVQKFSTTFGSCSCNCDMDIWLTFLEMKIDSIVFKNIIYNNNSRIYNGENEVRQSNFEKQNIQFKI